MFAEGAQGAGGAGDVAGRQLLGDQVHSGGLERRVQVEGLGEIGQCPAAIADAPPRFAPIDVGHRVIGLQLDVLFGGFEAFAEAAGGVVPGGELPPTEGEARVLGDQCLHRGDGLGAVAAAGLDPSGSATQFERRRIAQLRRPACRQRLLEAAGQS